MIETSHTGSNLMSTTYTPPHIQLSTNYCYYYCYYSLEAQSPTCPTQSDNFNSFSRRNFIHAYSKSIHSCQGNSLTTTTYSHQRYSSLYLRDPAHAMDLKAHEEELRDEYGIKEPEELFQDSWFFGNLLQRSCNKQSETIRRFSDPCTPSSSSNCSQELIMTGKSYEETYESIKKLSMVRDRDDDESSRPVLVKAPSMPSSMEGKDKTLLARGSGLRRSKLPSKKKSSSNLVRAPSLPVNLGDECFEDEEIEFSLGRLIRQASMNCSDSYLPPRTHDTKGTTPGSSLSRQRSRMKPEVEIIKGDVLEDTPPQHQQLEPRSRLTPPLKPDESQKLKTEEKSIRRSHYYYSEAWKEHNSSAPQVPLWDGKRSSNDTKEQIKFWARAVASNVRQEC